MKKNKGKVISILLIILLSLMQVNAYGHSGRTDANGGHKDNKNKSGLGSYHYHCGGNPPHLHTNGVCPYGAGSSNNGGSTSSSSSSKASSSSGSSSSNSKSSGGTSTTAASSSSNKPVATAKPSNIDVTEIQINKVIENIKVGETVELTATITPNDATDKTIKWESSDESIATINELGEFVAKKAGVVNINATTINGKSDTIQINIEDGVETKETSSTNIIPATQHDSTNNENDSDALGGLLTLGVLGGGGYWIYKRNKK